MKVFLDADAAPIIKEFEDLAKKYNEIEFIVVKNYNMRYESNEVKIITVDSAKESADFYIANNVLKNDLVITADKGLSSLIFSKNAFVMDFSGNILDERTLSISLNFRHINIINKRNKKYVFKHKKRNKNGNLIFYNSLNNFLEDFYEKKTRT